MIASRYLLALALAFYLPTLMTAQVEEVLRDDAPIPVVVTIGERSFDSYAPDFIEQMEQYLDSIRPLGKSAEVVAVQGMIAMAQLELSKAPETAVASAEGAVADAVQYFDNDAHPSTKYAYLVLLRSARSLDRNIQQSILYSERLLTLLERSSTHYYNHIGLIVEAYGKEGRYNAIGELLDELEQTVEADRYLSDIRKDEVRTLLLAKRIELYSAINSTEKTRLLASRFERLNRKTKLYKGFILANLYLAIARSYIDGSDSKAAEGWIDRAFGLSDELKTDAQRAILYSNVATVYHTIKALDKAIATALEAIEIMERDAYSRRNLPIAYTNLGMYYSNTKQYDEAERYIRKAYDYGQYYQIDVIYGQILLGQGKLQKALDTYQSALSKMCPGVTPVGSESPSDYSAGCPDRSYTRLALSGLAKIYLKLGKRDNDDVAYSRSLAASQQLYRLNRQDIDDQSGQYSSRMISSNRLAIDLKNPIRVSLERYQLSGQKDHLDDAFEYSERSKATLLLGALTPSPLPETEAAREQQHLDRIAQGKLDISTATPDSVNYYQEQQLVALQALESFYIRMRREYPRESTFLSESDPISPDALQASLAEDEVFVNYAILYEDKVAARLTTREGHTMQLLDCPDLDEDITRLRKLLQDPLLSQKKKRTEFVAVSHKLYQSLVAPLAGRMQDKKTLLIAPEGKLLYLPFEVLLPSDKVKPLHKLDYLIRDFAVNYQYSATARQRLQGQSSTRDGSLLAFAPVFGEGERVAERTRSAVALTDSLYNGVERGAFVPLPASEDEVTGIVEALPEGSKSDLLLRDAATEKNLLTKLRGGKYQYIHIATHGLVNLAKPELSGLACYESAGQQQLLFANEIQQLDLDADLVVLSSCESGIGNLNQSEGLLALNRSFVYAGARNVLSSLWKIDDTYSSRLMIDFYKELATGASYTDALRTAKLRMLDEAQSASPRYWASFVLFGE